MEVTNTTSTTYDLSGGYRLGPLETISVADADYQEDSTLNGQIDALVTSGVATVADSPSDTFPTAAVLSQHTTFLTHAQVRDLVSTPVEVIPAPGEGYAIDVLRVFINTILLPVSGVYTNISATSYLEFQWGALAGFMQLGQDTFFGCDFINNLFGQPSSDHTNTVAFGPWFDVGAPDLGAQPVVENPGRAVIDLPVMMKLVNSGNLTGGHASNRVQVTSLYWKLPVTGYVPLP